MKLSNTQNKVSKGGQGGITGTKGFLFSTGTIEFTSMNLNKNRSNKFKLPTFNHRLSQIVRECDDLLLHIEMRTHRADFRNPFSIYDHLEMGHWSLYM